MIAVDPHKASWTAAAVDASLQPLANIMDGQNEKRPCLTFSSKRGRVVPHDIGICSSVLRHRGWADQRAAPRDNSDLVLSRRSRLGEQSTDAAGVSSLWIFISVTILPSSMWSSWSGSILPGGGL
jgi:hypothetical protein